MGQWSSEFFVFVFKCQMVLVLVVKMSVLLHRVAFANLVKNQLAI